MPVAWNTVAERWPKKLTPSHQDDQAGADNDDDDDDVDALDDDDDVDDDDDDDEVDDDDDDDDDVVVQVMDGVEQVVSPTPSNLHNIIFNIKIYDKYFIHFITYENTLSYIFTF